MSHADRVMARLRLGPAPLCDDCMAEVCEMTQRQTAHQTCSRLERDRRILRDQRHCGRCRDLKICSSLPNQTTPLTATAPEPERILTVSDASLDDGERPWHWEGNVQNRLHRWLLQEGWRITQAVDTASRMQGVDLIANLEGRDLWVTVKGYPSPTARTNPPLQARHWFAGALMDVVLYRGSQPVIEIAVALPDGYKTYLSLAERTRWLRAAGPFHIYWVAESGAVRTEH